MRKRVRKPLAFLMALLMTMSVFGSQVMAEGTPSSDAAVVTQGGEGAAGDAASAETEGNDSGQSVQADNAKSAGQQGAGQTDTDVGNTAAASAEEGKQDAGQTDAQSTDAQSADGQNPDVQSADSQDVDAQSADAQGSDGSSEQQVEYVPEEQPDGVSVKAYAAKGTLPEGAVMKVTMLDAEGETSDQYDEAAAAMEESDVDYAGFLAMDISFYDADGNEIEPEDGAVNVQFEVDESLLPEDVEADSLAVQHLAETDDGIQVETVADAADQTDGNVAVENEAVKAEFEVERFSYFTITYYYQNIKVYLVDESGTQILGNLNEKFGENITNWSLGEWTDFESLVSDNISQAESEGYTYKNAHANSYNGETVNWIKYRTRSYYPFGSWRYSSNSYKPSDNSSGETLSSIYLVFEKNEQGGGTTPGDITEPTPGYSKTATLNDDGTYDLTLSVTGAVGSQENKALVDLLMIADTSGSMDDYGRLRNAKTAMRTLVSSLEEQDTVDARYSIVRFSGSRNNNTATNMGASSVALDWTDITGNVESSNVYSAINSLSANGGTNYQAGLERGIEQLGNTRSGAITIVIFLSDGEPTYYLGGGDGNDGLGIYSNGWAQTLTTAKRLSCTRFYSIGIGNSYTQYLGDGDRGLCSHVNAGTATYISADNDGSNLTSIFQDIAGSATQLNVSNVTISDTLSGNVEAAVEENGELKELSVKVTDKEGNDVTATEKQAGSISPTFSNGVLRLDFDDDYELKDEYTYSVTLKIQPSASAEIAYAKTGTYPDTPDKNTGTHQNEKGFYSNENDKAILTYKTDNDPKLKEVKYDKPVVQVQKGYLTLEKELAEGTTVPNGTEFTFTVSIPAEYAGTYNALYSSDTEGNGTQVEFVAESGSENATAEIKLSAKEKVTIALPDKIQVHITENSDGYTAEWEGGTEDGNGVTAKISKSTRVEITCTNSLATGSLTVTKKVEGIDQNDIGLVQEEIFQFEIAKLVENSEQVDTSFSDEALGFSNGIKVVKITGTGSSTIEKLPIGNYRVQETSYANELGNYKFVSKTGEGTVSVTGAENSKIEITNTYQHKDKTIAITKKVEGNMGEKDKEFDFILTLKQGSVSYTEPISAKKNGTDVATSITATNGEYSFKLKDNETIELIIPYGLEYSISEKSEAGYEVDIEVNQGSAEAEGSLTGTLNSDVSATFTNTKNIDAPTGITRAVVPFAVMVIIALGAVVTFVVRRRIRR